MSTDDTTAVDLSRYAEDCVATDIRSLPCRFPMIRHEYPRWNYITAVVIGEEGRPYNVHTSPTDEELAVVASFHDQYINHWYRVGWLNQMREKHPFDIDGGANGRFLCKYKHGGWGVKLRSWEHGPRPAFSDEPMTLVQVLDRHFHLGTDYPSQRWIDWKAARPEIFGGAS